MPLRTGLPREPFRAAFAASGTFSNAGAAAQAVMAADSATSRMYMFFFIFPLASDTSRHWDGHGKSIGQNPPAVKRPARRADADGRSELFLGSRLPITL